MRTRCKICGVTSPQVAAAAADAGADAVGLAFVDESPRAVTPQQAVAVAGALPPFVSRVGLFANASEQHVRHVLQVVDLDLLQFHGDEDDAWCRRFGVPYVKAVRVGGHVRLAGQLTAFPGASALLLDSWTDGVQGGSGEVFDWRLIPAMEQPLVLAGGLDAGNVGKAIRQARPYAVDVSSGVESRRGVKSPQLIRAFLQAVDDADRQSAAGPRHDVRPFAQSCAGSAS